MLILKGILGDLILKSSCTCIKALLITKTSRVRYAKATLYYRFILGNETYEGNSLVEDLSKVGDSVCIVYLESLPSINRPISYFKKGEIKCNCGIH